MPIPIQPGRAHRLTSRGAGSTMREKNILAVFADYVARLPDSLQDKPHLRSGRRQSPEGGQIDRFQELLPEVPPTSSEEAEAIDRAWESLFARAARGHFGLEAARQTLSELDPAWTDADEAKVFGLLQESTAQLRELANEPDGAASSEKADETVRAAREVQFSVAQLFAASQAAL